VDFIEDQWNWFFPVFSLNNILEKEWISPVFRKDGRIVPVEIGVAASGGVKPVAGKGRLSHLPVAGFGLFVNGGSGEVSIAALMLKIDAKNWLLN
jgi:hypothetical protein